MISQTLQFKQAWHLDPALLDSAAKNIDPAGLAGRWVNTNHETRGVSELTLEHDGKNFRVSLVGVGAAGPIDWPRTEVETFANLEKKVDSEQRRWSPISISVLWRRKCRFA